jgi:DNA-binding CsgD family transcriptional regulator
LLTPREKEIMELVIRGYTIAEISKTLFISESTVITHKQHIQDKLHAKNSCHCVTLYLKGKSTQ